MLYLQYHKKFGEDNLPSFLEENIFQRIDIGITLSAFSSLKFKGCP